MAGCGAALSWMAHAAGGAVLDLGRRRRRASKAIRKAARERDHGRCRYPGCESRRVDLHHIQHWANGGPTSLHNLVSLCKQHHMAVHDRGCLIAARPGGTFTFYAPGGTPIPASPPLPAPDGAIGDVHDADITPDTIIPPWHGERLDLDYAIYTCLANEQVRRDRETGRDPRDDGPGATVYGSLDREEYDQLRERLAGPPTYRPVQIPIQV
jgi:HNH endonuclease